MDTKELRNESARTSITLEPGQLDRFSRNQRLDRPFLSQSPGYAALDEVTWRPSRVSDPVGSSRDDFIPPVVAGADQDSVSVDDIVDMLADRDSEQRFQAETNTGVFVTCARQVEQRIAGAPLK